MKKRKAVPRASECFPFFYIQLQRPGSRDISQSGCAAKDAASPARLMPFKPARALPLFYINATFSLTV